jgi:hypothetical protein
MRIKRSPRLAVIRLAALAVLSSRSHFAAADVTATWLSDVSGSYASSSKWSTAPNFPANGKPVGTDYVALINAVGKDYLITYSSGDAVDFLDIDSSYATLQQVGGTFTPATVNLDAGTFEITAGTLQDATIDFSINNSNIAAFEATGGTLSNVSIQGGAVSIDPGAVTVENTLSLTNCSVTLNGAFASAQIGDYSANSETNFYVAGTINNTGANLPLATIGGNWSLQEGTITGGTISIGAGQLFDASSGTLNGVSTTGGEVQAGLTTFTNGFNAGNQTVEVDDGCDFDGTQTIDDAAVVGYGNIVISNVNNPGSPTTLTIGPNANVTGDFSIQTTDAGTLVNNGTMDAPVFAYPLQISTVSLVNNGTLQATGFNDTLGYSSNLTIDSTNFTNNGLITATDGGTVQISSNFTNTGVIAVHGGTIVSTNLLDVGEGTLTGDGTIDANVQLDSDPSTLAFNIGGEIQDTDYDSLIIDGDITLGGNLEITLANGFIPNPGDVFTVLDVEDGDALSGDFVNVLDGQYLLTTDGTGEFVVNYSPGTGEIVLSDFQAVPEPASAGLLLSAAGAMLIGRRRS